MNENEEYRENAEEEEFAYKNVIEENKNSHIWSAASIALGVLSIILCFIPIVGIIFGLASAAFAVVSRRMLGYFENLAVTGLVVGIFGTVFGIFYAVYEFLLNSGII